ncbi:MAG: HAMP domain-containing protein [PVC group bacterium]|nr:HAMP domain-containing protein [PVC group bacterium]
MFLKKEAKTQFFKSVRGKLIIGYALVLLISVFIVLGYIYLQINNAFIFRSKEYLKTELSHTVQLLQNEQYDQSAFSNFLSKRISFMHGPYKVGYALFDDKGLLIARAENFLEHQHSVAMLSTRQVSAVEDVYEHSMRTPEGKTVFFAAQAITDANNETVYLQFGLDVVGNPEAAAILLKTLLFAVPAILLIAIIGGMFLTGRILAPITQLINAAKNLSFTDSKHSLPLAGTGDELDQLAGSFNEVVNNLRGAYQRIVAFSADASHELRLPITAIKGEAEVVLEREHSLSEYQRVLSSIIEDMDRLMAMISRLMSLTRADSGEDIMERESVDLKELLSKLTDFYLPLAESKTLKLEFACAGDALTTEADILRLQELFSNLIENAIKYTAEQGTIKIELSKTAEYYQISFIDTGIGIPPSEHDKIFERFYRVAKSRSRIEGGAGLGLSIARMIAKSHNGTITVTSEPNKGSCFQVILPVFPIKKT